MTNTKLTRRALLSSVLALVLCFTMLLGTTFAWFTDEAVSSGNKIVAGNLDVELWLCDENGKLVTDISKSTASLFGGANSLVAQNDNTDTLWEPGKTQVVYLAIKNAGNLDLKYQVALNVANPTDGTDGKNLYEVMQYAIAVKPEGGVTEWDATNANSVELGSQAVGSGYLAPNGIDFFALSVHMDENAGNAYEGGKVEFDLTVFATQLNSEKDSFDETYDENATYTVSITKTATVKADDEGNVAEETKITYANEGSAISNVDVTVPVGVALDENVTELVLTVEEKDAVDSNVTISSTETAKTYEIDIKGISENNTEPVTVSLTIETGLADVKLYHNGDLIDSTYDADTGVLTFETTGFSPFTVVHKQNATEIDILRNKLAAAKSGDTVEFALTKDAHITEQINVPEGVDLVLDGNGHTVNMDLSGYGIRAYRADITIKNVIIKGSAKSAILTIGDRGIVDGKMVEYLVYPVLENVTVDMDEVVYSPVYFNGMGVATLTNCTFTGAGFPTDDYREDSHVFAGAEMKVIVDGGNVGTVFINANNNSPESTFASGITVNSGTVEKLILESDWLDDKTGSATYTNNGGTVNEVVKAVDTGAEMASAIKEGYSVALHKDISYDGVISPASGTSFNIYGYNYTVNASIYTVGGGNFVFNDMIWGGAASYAFYNQGGNVTMNNVTVEKDGDYVLLLYGGGVVELNDCKVTGTATSKTSIWFGDGRTVTINGGTYSSMIINASKGAGMVSAGTLTLNDASVEKVRVGAVEDAGTITRANVINNNSTVGEIEYEK